MSFGLRNAAQTFQHFMDEVLKDLHFCFSYLDDILVFIHSAEEHKQYLRDLFTQLKKHGILLNPSKCVFRVPEVSFLGYRTSSLGWQPLPEHIADLQTCAPSKTVGKIRRFLGMLNIYRQFLPKAASTQAPLHNVLSGPRVKGSDPVTCTPELHMSFTDCKANLSQAAVSSPGPRRSPCLGHGRINQFHGCHFATESRLLHKGKGSFAFSIEFQGPLSFVIIP